MTNPIEHLSRLITSETVGIIWLTDIALNSELQGVYEFNYLTNGLLTKSIQSKDEKTENANFFISESFGKSFFLSHLVIESSSDIKKMYNHMELAKPLIDDTISLVYIFNKSSNTKGIKVIKELTKRYPGITFENLTI